MAELIVFLVFTYALVGSLFAILFLTRGIQQLDAQTIGAGIGFRLIILPGVVALWPFLLKGWIRRD